MCVCSCYRPTITIRGVYRSIHAHARSRHQNPTPPHHNRYNTADDDNFTQVGMFYRQVRFPFPLLLSAFTFLCCRCRVGGSSVGPTPFAPNTNPN